MPKKKPIEKAKEALRKGKSPSTAAGEFIRVEMDNIGVGRNSAGSREQAIAIGLSKARRAGIPLRPQSESPAEARSRRSVEKAYAVGQKKKKKKKRGAISKKRSNTSQKRKSRAKVASSSAT